tara:strand:+ start:752 stop:1252 length:501 start_codon:yes stop_codon:yes gene_type:complete
MTSDEKYILEWYKNKIWTKPSLSKVCEGIGMVAIRDIPKGTSVFDLADRSVYGWIPWEQAKKIPKGVLNWVLECQPQLGDKVMDNPNFKKEWFDDQHPALFAYTQVGMNWQTTWYYVNHSEDNPNVSANSTGHPRVLKYIALRDIYEGEEILENYNGYTSQWKLDI